MPLCMEVFCRLNNEMAFSRLSLETTLKTLVIEFLQSLARCIVPLEVTEIATMYSVCNVYQRSFIRKSDKIIRSCFNDVLLHRCSRRNANATLFLQYDKCTMHHDFAQYLFTLFTPLLYYCPLLYLSCFMMNKRFI